MKNRKNRKNRKSTLATSRLIRVPASAQQRPGPHKCLKFLVSAGMGVCLHTSREREAESICPEPTGGTWITTAWNRTSHTDRHSTSFTDRHSTSHIRRTCIRSRLNGAYRPSAPVGALRREEVRPPLCAAARARSPSPPPRLPPPPHRVACGGGHLVGCRRLSRR